MNCKKSAFVFMPFLALLCSMFFPTSVMSQSNDNEERDVEILVKPVIEKEECGRKLTYTDNKGTDKINKQIKIVHEENLKDKTWGTYKLKKVYSVDSTFYKDGKIKIIKEKENCNGGHDTKEIIILNEKGKIINYEKTTYDNSGFGIKSTVKIKIEKGIWTYDKTEIGKPPEHEEKLYKESEDNNKITEAQGNLTLCPCLKPANQIFIGLSTNFEDSYKRFNTYGGNITYTHSLSEQTGLTGDGGIYFGSQSGINFTKIQVLAGISILPRNASTGRVSFSPHLLAGIVNIRSKYSSTFRTSSSAFSAAVGTDIRLARKDKKIPCIRADYNPAFRSGGMAHNFRISAGVIL